jgi:hypothetical protein
LDCLYNLFPPFFVDILLIFSTHCYVRRFLLSGFFGIRPIHLSTFVLLFVEDLGHGSHIKPELKVQSSFVFAIAKCISTHSQLLFCSPTDGLTVLGLLWKEDVGDK